MCAGDPALGGWSACRVSAVVGLLRGAAVGRQMIPLRERCWCERGAPVWGQIPCTGGRCYGPGATEGGLTLANRASLTLWSGNTRGVTPHPDSHYPWLPTRDGHSSPGSLHQYHGQGSLHRSIHLGPRMSFRRWMCL